MAIVQQKPIFDDVADWPAQSGPAPAGHNRPPMEELIPAEFRRDLLSGNFAALALIADWWEESGRYVNAMFCRAALANIRGEANVSYQCGNTVYIQNTQHVTPKNKPVSKPGAIHCANASP